MKNDPQPSTEPKPIPYVQVRILPNGAGQVQGNVTDSKTAIKMLLMGIQIIVDQPVTKPTLIVPKIIPPDDLNRKN